MSVAIDDSAGAVGALNYMDSLAVPIHSLAVRRKPKSGKPSELLDYEGISHKTIVKKARERAGA